MQDAVTIIGSSLGGLICGAVLAKSGVKIRVLERHMITGGYANSYTRRIHEIAEPAEYEQSLHLLRGTGKRKTLRSIMAEIGVLERMEFIRAKSLYGLMYPDDKISVAAYEDYVHQLKVRFPDDIKGMQALFKEFIQLHQEMLHMMILSNSGISIDLCDGPTLLAYDGVSLEEMLREYLTSDELKSIIAQHWIYYGMPPSKISAACYAYAWGEHMMFGGYYPKVGSKTLSNVLIDIIREHGGEVLTGEKVTRIYVENGMVEGLQTKKMYYSSNVIISNADPIQTIKQLVGYDHVPSRYMKKIESLKMELESMQLHLELNIDFALRYGERDHEIFVNEHYDPEQGYRELVEERYESLPFTITIYDNLTQDDQSKGKTRMCIFTRSRNECWDTLNDVEYEGKKDKVIRAILHRLERIYPGITQYVENTTLLTPRSKQMNIGNLQGAIYGAQQTVSHCLLRRLPQKTPIAGLYLASGWTQPGGGFTGSIWSGYHLAKQLLLQSRELVSKP